MSALATLEAPDTSAIEQQRDGVVSVANAIRVTNNQEMVGASDVLRQIKTTLKTIDAEVDPSIRKAHEAHKEIVSLKKRLTAPLEEAERIVKSRISQYTMAQEKARQAEEMRLREIARQQEEDRRLAEAIELEREGSQEALEQAQAIIEAPVVAPVVVVQKTVPKVEGISTRKVWKYRIVNEHQIPREYMTPNEKAIGAYCRSMGANAKMCGVEFYSEDVVSAAGF